MSIMARELARNTTPSSALGALVGNRSLLRTVMASAALGGSDVLSGENEVTTLVVRGDEERPTSFEATVSEYIIPTPLPRSRDAPEPAGAAVEGAVTDEAKRYVFTGQLMDLRVDGPGKVFVDGREVDPEAIGN